MAEDGTPAVSVIMATYNGAPFVGDTIETLLAQSFTDFELIVVDDASTDNTADIVRSYNDPRIRLLASTVNCGPVRARNQGVAIARGRYIAAMDQDDLCLPDRFARQVAYLDAHPGTVLLGTASHNMIAGRLVRDRLPRPTTANLIYWRLHVLNPLIWSSVMIRAAAISQLAEFSRQDRLFAEDYDLYHRLAPLGDIARLDDVLLIYRKHPQGASITRQAQMLRSAAAVLADAYLPWFGDNAAHAADLMTRHLSGRQPIPGIATLLELRAILAQLNRRFLRDHRDRSPSRARIETESHLLLLRVATDTLRARLRNTWRH